METAVVIVAAGRGTRAPGGDMPKQYRELDGQPVLARTIGCFAEQPDIENILVVIHGDDREHYTSATDVFDGRLLQPVAGAATRQASVHAGLRRLREYSPRCVLIHDAARPFASPALIERVTLALSEHDGAVPGLPVTDTLKQVEGGRVKTTVDRAGLWSVQTPQGFAFDAILSAHDAAGTQNRFDFTDDASLAEWHGLDVAVVDGEKGNVKLTTDGDFAIAEQQLRADGTAMAGEMRVGQGFDVHAFGPGDHVMLGGVEIPHERGLSGHSDADVVLHAVTDALLGTIGDGDIGTHFPPGDPQWKGTASDVFLRDAMNRVAARGGDVINLDITVVCEEPRIGPHRDAMRRRIAEIMNLDQGRVSVKATTSEGLGFTGRREGIAAQAAVMVRFR